MAPSPHADFALALRENSRPAGHAPTRFAIYRGNRQAALTESLAASFPAVQRIVGERFFAGLARAFVAAHPPRTPVLHEYGADFADFVDSFEPAADLPYLSGVAQIEWAWICAYHAADCTPAGAEVLNGLSDAALADTCFRLHPSAAMIRCVHPAGTIWQMNIDGGTPGPIEDWCGQNVLVLRPRRAVEVRILPEDTALFVAALASGLPLGLAAEAGRRTNPDFDLAAQLAGAFGLGLIAGTSPPPAPERTP